MLDTIERFVADARIEETTRARGRERWLRQRSAEGSTMAGVCWDLAERGEQVVVTTAAGGHHRGHIEALGEDFLAVRTMAGTVVVPCDGLLTIAVHGRAEPGARPVRRGLELAEVVAELAATRPTVRARFRAGDAVVGELCHGGRDVAAVRVGEGGRGTVYVRLSSLSELSVLSG